VGLLSAGRGVRGALLFLVVCWPVAACSSGQDDDCGLPEPTSSPLGLHETVRVEVTVPQKYEERRLDVNGGIYTLPTDPNSDATVSLVPPGRHVFKISRTGKHDHLLAEDSTGWYRLGGRIGCG
jgi:hypothetical protein